jgi:hypothetical protein
MLRRSTAAAGGIAMSAPSPQADSLLPDLDMARAFLTALDENADTFCFQTFADSPAAKARKKCHGKDPVARTFHGTLDELAPALIRHYRE